MLSSSFSNLPISENIDNNALRIAQNKETYKRRQAIVEHPFGIIKRQWDFYYIMTKRGIKRASADVGLMFCAFNLRRILNLIDKKVLKAWLDALILFFEQYRRYCKPKLVALFCIIKLILQNTSFAKVA